MTPFEETLAAAREYATLNKLDAWLEILDSRDAEAKRGAEAVELLREARRQMEALATDFEAIRDRFWEAAERPVETDSPALASILRGGKQAQSESGHAYNDAAKRIRALLDVSTAKEEPK